MKVNASFILMCMGLILLALWKMGVGKNNKGDGNGLQEGFLDHGIREDREKFRFHPYNIQWMARAKAYDQMMLREKARVVEMGSLCQPGFVDLGRDPLKVDLWSYPELVFHPLDERTQDVA